jgi:hypothetical protein
MPTPWNEITGASSASNCHDSTSSSLHCLDAASAQLLNWQLDRPQQIALSGKGGLDEVSRGKFICPVRIGPSAAR